MRATETQIGTSRIKWKFRMDRSIGENMRPSHILELGALVFFALFLVVQSKRGVLKGGLRVAAFVALGLFALAWVANLYGK
jgi:hypothetical protein